MGLSLRRGCVLLFLFVRVSSLGVVVLFMPMVADIRRRFPDAQIDWVVEEAYTDLVRLNDQARAIIPIALRRWRKSLHSAMTWAEMRNFYQSLRREAYDVVFVLLVLFLFCVVLCLLCLFVFVFCVVLVF